MWADIAETVLHVVKVETKHLISEWNLVLCIDRNFSLQNQDRDLVYIAELVL